MGPPSAFSNWPKSGLSPLISMVFIKIYTRWKSITFAFLAAKRRLWPYEISLDQIYSKRADQPTAPRYQCYYDGTLIHFNIAIFFSLQCWILLLYFSVDSKQLWFLTLHQLEKLCQLNTRFLFITLQVLQKLSVVLLGEKACGCCIFLDS